MPGIESLIVFLVAVVVICVVPGPAVLYVVTRSMAQGKNAGVISVAGVAVGGMVHVVAATLGFSAILATSAVAFSIVKYLGAAYLIYLGVKQLISRNSAVANVEFQPEPLKKIFLEGIFVQVLNPKAALFLFAFLPQFVDASAGSVQFQTMMLGMMFIVIAFISDGAYAIFAGTLGRLLRGRPNYSAVTKKFSGLIYIGIGMAAAFSSNK